MCALATQRWKYSGNTKILTPEKICGVNTMIKPHFELMAAYNALMNQKICDRISTVADDTLWEDEKAFFGQYWVRSITSWSVI